MSDQPKVYVIRPNELREQSIKWLMKLDEPPTMEKPVNGYNPGGILPNKGDA